MRVRRLGWAGIEIECDGESLVVDLLEDVSPLVPFSGEPREPLPAPARPGHARTALVTHLHSDHADPAAIARALAPDGVLLRPAPADGEGLEVIATTAAEMGIEQAEVATRSVAPWESVEQGPFRLTAVPAVDGFGDPQVSWVIEAGGRRVLHAGDTLFHGSWWLIAMRHGPFDAAFLPINGPVCDLPHRQPPSPLPAAMDPEQAAVAAALLRAELAVPIHYGTLHRPPTYVETDDPLGRFRAAAAARGIAVSVLAPGDELELGPPEASG